MIHESKLEASMSLMKLQKPYTIKSAESYSHKDQPCSVWEIMKLQKPYTVKSAESYGHKDQPCSGWVASPEFQEARLIGRHLGDWPPGLPSLFRSPVLHPCPGITFPNELFTLESLSQALLLGKGRQTRRQPKENQKTLSQPMTHTFNNY